MFYSVQDDLSLIREFFKLTQEEFAKVLGVDKITIVRTENGESYPRIELID